MWVFLIFQIAYTTWNVLTQLKSSVIILISYSTAAIDHARNKREQ